MTHQITKKINFGICDNIMNVIIVQVKITWIKIFIIALNISTSQLVHDSSLVINFQVQTSSIFF